MEQESKIRKVLFNEVTFVIAVIGVVGSVIIGFTAPISGLSERVSLVEQEQKNAKEERTALSMELAKFRDQVTELTKTIAILNARLEK